MAPSDMKIWVAGRILEITFQIARSVCMIIDEVLIKLFSGCKDGNFLTQLHSLTIKTGLSQDSIFASKLINHYSKLAPFPIARKLFDETPHRPVYLWNCLLKSYCRDKHYTESLSLFSQLFSVEKLDFATISISLKACAALKELEFGKAIHGFVKKSDPMGRNLFIGSGLVEMYSKCGRMDDACLVFEEYSEPDTVLWTSMIAGYQQNGDPNRALDLFSQMVATNGIVPDPITLVSVVSACIQISNLKLGRCIHGYTVRLGFNSNLSLSNALLSLYGKMGLVSDAFKLFKKMEEKDVISWGSMIACYAHQGVAGEALYLFEEMIASGIEPNGVVFICSLQACEATCNLEKGRIIHELASKCGLDSDVLISTALIDMYMNCSSPCEAIRVFESMREKDAVCYSALLHGCIQNRMIHKSIEIFSEMLSCGIKIDATDLVKVVTACSELGVLQQTSCIHGFAIRQGRNRNCYVRASLIESYAKCGSLDDAVSVFRETEDRDVVIWSSISAGYGYHGKGIEAIELFHAMIKYSCVKPNDVFFVSLLSACSHAGLFKEGIDIFNMMLNEYQLIPNSKHYSIMVNLLGRIGELDEAMKVIGSMPEPIPADVWGALISACWIHQNMEVAEMASMRLQELDSGDAGQLVLLSNMYSVDEKWDKAAEVRRFVKEKQLKKVSGQSVIELRNGGCGFVANDRSHQEFKQIYEMLTRIEGNLKVEELNFNSVMFCFID